LKTACAIAKELNVSLDDMVVDKSTQETIDIQRQLASIDMQIARLNAKRTEIMANLLLKNHNNKGCGSDEEGRLITD
jgi:hypothetical protein